MSGDAPYFRRERGCDYNHMLQIGNITHALAEGRHSLNKIMGSEIALPAKSRVNNGNNVDARRKGGSWDWGIRTP
jgi:hypothetical protein